MHPGSEVAWPGGATPSRGERRRLEHVRRWMWGPLAQIVQAGSRMLLCRHSGRPVCLGPVPSNTSTMHHRFVTLSLPCPTERAFMADRGKTSGSSVEEQAVAAVSTHIGCMRTHCSHGTFAAAIVALHNMHSSHSCCLFRTATTLAPLSGQAPAAAVLQEEAGLEAVHEGVAAAAPAGNGVKVERQDDVAALTCDEDPLDEEGHEEEQEGQQPGTSCSLGPDQERGKEEEESQWEEQEHGQAAAGGAVSDAAAPASKPRRRGLPPTPTAATPTAAARQGSPSTPATGTKVHVCGVI